MRNRNSPVLSVTRPAWAEPLLEQELFRGPSFGHVLMWNFALIPFSRYIKLAITGAIFGYIRDSVYAWADNVFVVLSIVSGQPARATHISVALPVCNKPLQEFKDFFLIRVEKVTLGLLEFSSRFHKASQLHSLLSNSLSISAIVSNT